MAIEMTVLCRDLHVLPKTGGLLDQDSYHVWLIDKTLAVLSEKEQNDMKAEQRKATMTRKR